MKKYLLNVVVLMVTFSSITVYAQSGPASLNINVEGIALINQNDVARARENAIKDALEKAILQVATKLSSSQPEDEKFQALKSVIIAAPDKYINNYKIISERQQQQEFLINVNVDLALSSLKNDLSQMGIVQEQPMVKHDLTILVNVKKLKKYSDYSSLKHLLQSYTKVVKGIYPCHFGWQQAHFTIEIFGDAKALIDELVKTGRFLPDEKQTDHNRIEMICLQNRETE